MGMIYTIINSRGRAFVEMWFLMFTGYINCMLGYHHMLIINMWYSWLPKKEAALCIQVVGCMDRHRC